MKNKLNLVARCVILPVIIVVEFFYIILLCARVLVEKLEYGCGVTLEAVCDFSDKYFPLGKKDEK